MAEIQEREARVPVKVEGTFASLWRRVQEARATMVRVQRALAADADSDADADDQRKIEYPRLLEANEQLVLAAIRSLTEADTAERELKEVWHRAEHDALTGLPNRVLLMDRCAHAIANAKRHGVRLALLYLDLNLFKQINDTLGHAVGDEVLKHAARCLASAVRGSDTVSRHGGDEFLILIDEVSTALDAAVIADKVVAALGAPSHFGNQTLRLTASIGISVYPEDGEDVEALIRKADAAMYRAKKHGQGGYVFSGDEPVGVRTFEHSAHESLQRPLSRYDLSLAEYERLQIQLREANEQLLLCVLSPAELRAAADEALKRQKQIMDLLAPETQHPLAPIRDLAVLLGRIRTFQMAKLSRFVSGSGKVTRSRPGKLKLATQVLDLASIIDNAAGISNHAMEARLQAFSVRMPDRAVEARGDPDRLGQIFRNLFDNAARYTQHGGLIDLQITVDENQAVVTLSDNGAGISAEVLPHVFEPFVQDVHTLGLNSDGLGIGLTVARLLVQAHGGELSVSSDGRGQGSRFTVSLPLAARPG